MTIERFVDRTSAELRLAKDHVRWLNAQVASGRMKPEHAAGYIDNETRIINTKRFILGLATRHG